jgi:hypothetical protein
MERNLTPARALIAIRNDDGAQRQGSSDVARIRELRGALLDHVAWALRTKKRRTRKLGPTDQYGERVAVRKAKP